MTRDKASLIKHILRSGDTRLALDMLFECGASVKAAAKFIQLARG